MMSTLPPDDEKLVPWYRALIIADISLVGIGFLLALFSHIVIEMATGEPVEFEPNFETVADVVLVLVAGILVIFLLGALIAAWIGLFMWKPWARWLYLSFVILECAINLLVALFQVAITWAFVSAVYSTSALIRGAIVAIVFASPLAGKFVARRGPQYPQHFEV